MKKQTQLHMPVTRGLGRQKQKAPWSLLASRIHQSAMTDPVSKKKVEK